MSYGVISAQELSGMGTGALGLGPKNSNYFYANHLLECMLGHLTAFPNVSQASVSNIKRYNKIESQ